MENFKEEKRKYKRYNTEVNIYFEFKYDLETKVKFELIDLFDTPRFKPNSVVWASNVFDYEATLFEYGYDYVTNKRKELTELNLDCMILTSQTFLDNIVDI